MAKRILSSLSTMPPGKTDKSRIKAKTEKILNNLEDLQNLLYAESRHSILVIIQGMDASGKDGLVGSPKVR